jgi:hypothetical protein
MIIMTNTSASRKKPVTDTTQTHLIPTPKEKTKRLNTLIPLSLHQQLKDHAKRKGRCHTITSVLTDIITTYLKQPFDENGNPIPQPIIYPRLY